MEKLLLHVCCAPCFVGCVDRLLGTYELFVCFYNPNLGIKEEYDLRKQEFYSLLQKDSKFNDIQIVEADYEKEVWEENVIGFEKEREQGKRCDICFDIRLDKVAMFAKAKGCDLFATTLTLSPLKKAEKINAIGESLGDKYGVRYLPTNFKKQNGVKLSADLSKKYQLYRQNYCGCIYSKGNR